MVLANPVVPLTPKIWLEMIDENPVGPDCSKSWVATVRAIATCTGVDKPSHKPVFPCMFSERLLAIV